MAHANQFRLDRDANITRTVPTRRDVLFGLGASLGSVALTALLGEDSPARAETAPNPLAPKPGHLPAKAKRCIFLMMEGGPSHIDTFDPKPDLAWLHLKEFTREGQMKSAMESGKRYYVQSPFKFRKAAHPAPISPKTGNIWLAVSMTSAFTAAARSIRSTIRPPCTR